MTNKPNRSPREYRGRASRKISTDFLVQRIERIDKILDRAGMRTNNGVFKGEVHVASSDTDLIFENTPGNSWWAMDAEYGEDILRMYDMTHDETFVQFERVSTTERRIALLGGDGIYKTLQFGDNDDYDFRINVDSETADNVDMFTYDNDWYIRILAYEGAALYLYGGSHASSPGDASLDANRDVRLEADRYVTLDAAEELRGYCGTADQINLQGDGSGAQLQIFGGTHATYPTEIRATCDSFYISGKLYLTDNLDLTGATNQLIQFDTGDYFDFTSNVYRFYIGSSAVCAITNTNLVHSGEIRANSHFDCAGSNGWTGTFTNGAGATVTVTGGIITSVV